jgi:valyl-tRNA synthetase
MLEKKYDFKVSEEKWRNYWEKNKIYEFKKDERKIYSIDTPPPTVSGKIHIGHIFSYTQAEIIARFKRLNGFNVFYPFGFDDNGLPSERLVEKENNIKASMLSREEFNKLCYDTTDRYENEFKELFSRLGVSTDWNLKYKTVSPSSIKVSQLSFLDLVEKGNAYYKESPALWCTECGTSIAQAELETKKTQTTFNYINYKTIDGITFTIATTRPELIGACVSIFINPLDEKNNYLIGKTAIIPIFNFEVPIMADEKVAVDKGTGIVMCCTFGDQTDIEWWKKYNLPLKKIFTNDGKIVSEIEKYGGLKIKEARKQIIEDLKELNLIVKIEDLEHEIQVHERCGKDIEYSVINQWFIDILNNKDKFLDIANKIKWYPAHMKARYDEWVKNVMWDWCISRQRFFGVPFPIWYCKDCGKPIFAQKEDLPVNPLTDKPKINCECGCKEFIPEKDVMDTWATSSVTPLINMKYKEKDNYEDILNPMSLRCNAHDIIRTWDFYTIVKSFYHLNNKPWENVMVSGFVMADKGEKISKSKGNNKFEPLDLINEYSADVIRYWAASGRLGTDIIFSDETLLRGKKFINKLYNMASFVSMHLEDYEDKEFDNFEYFDKWVIGKYMDTESSFLKYLKEYEIGLALNVLEKFFWNFCDNYIEIVKHRLYRPEEFKEGARYSGQKTIYMLLYKLLQDFSIFFPFITEELFQNIYGNEKSIHATIFKPLKYNFEEESIEGDNLINLISEVRGFKTNNNVSLKTPIKIEIILSPRIAEILNESIDDIRATLTIINENIKIGKIKKYKINKISLPEMQQV